jgi:hypothetical protein
MGIYKPMSKSVQSDASRNGINALTLAVNHVSDRLQDVQADVTDIKTKLESRYVTTDMLEARMMIIEAKYGPTSKYMWQVLLIVSGVIITVVLNFFLRK